MPFLSGIEMSSNTTSKSAARTAATVSDPLAASAVTSMSTWSAMNCRSPARTMAWSSAIKIRIIESPQSREARGSSLHGSESSTFGLVRGKPVVECLQADAQHLRGAALVAATVIERREDGLPLHFCERRADRHPQALSFDRRAREAREIELDELLGHDE